MSAHNYIGVIEGQPAAFCSLQHFPHPKAKNIKRIHRIVVLPDYQGIGIGKRMMNYLAALYRREGFRVRIVTSLTGFINSLSSDKYWRMDGHARNSAQGVGLIWIGSSRSRYTGSFEYIGPRLPIALGIDFPNDPAHTRVR